MILDAMLGKWDHSLCYSADATMKVRKEIVTCIKEGEAEAERAASETAVVRSRDERRAWHGVKPAPLRAMPQQPTHLAHP